MTLSRHFTVAGLMQTDFECHGNNDVLIIVFFFSSGIVHAQSSQLAEPLWIDSGLKSGTGERELIST